MFKFKEQANEYNIGMRICFLLTGVIFLPTVTASLLILFSVEIGIYTFPLGMALLILLYTILFFDKRHVIKFFIPIIIASVLGAVSIILSMYIWDSSWDGWMYHAPAVMNLADGWNPLYEHSDVVTISKYFSGVNSHMIWVEHYPKFIWIFGATLLKITGNIFAGTGISTILIICTYIISVDVFSKNKKIPKVLPYFVGLIFSLNAVIISQLFTYYNDGVLGNALVCLILILYGVSKGYYSYKNNYILVFFVTFFVCMLVNSKQSTALAAFIIMAMFFVYYAFTNIIKRKDKFTIYFAAILLFITILVAVNTYLVNIIYHGNIGYPIVGSEKIDIVMSNTPKGLRTDTKFIALFKSLTSETNYDVETLKYTYKLPHIISMDEIKAMGYVVDVRYGGFGPAFQSILWGLIPISILILIQRSKDKKLKALAKAADKKERRKRYLEKQNNKKTLSAEALVMIVFLALIVFFPHLWWARYAPFIYVIPCLIIMLFNQNWKKFNLMNILSVIVLIIYIASSLVYVNYRLRYALIETDKIKQDIAHFKELSINSDEPINIASASDRTSYKMPVSRRLLDQNDVDYIEYSIDETLLINDISGSLGIGIVEPITSENSEIVDELLTTVDINDYFRILEKNIENYIVVIASKDDASMHIKNIGPNRLGLNKITDLKLQESYIGIIDGKTGFVYEQISADALMYKYDELTVKSAGYHVGNTAGIIRNNINYAVNSRGLNICVFDANTMTIINSVIVDSYFDENLEVIR